MWSDWSTEALQEERRKLRNELGWIHGGAAHGGPAQTNERAALLKQINEISAEIERRGES